MEACGLRTADDPLVWIIVVDRLFAAKDSRWSVEHYARSRDADSLAPAVGHAVSPHSRRSAFVAVVRWIFRRLALHRHPGRRDTGRMAPKAFQIGVKGVIV